VKSKSSSKQTVQSCIDMCRGEGYSYAGLEEGSDCYCGDSYARYGPGDKCDKACTGDSSQICGGHFNYNAYSVCRAGFYGYNCKEQCGHCSSAEPNCQVHSGVCLFGCEEGWSGPDCNTQGEIAKCENDEKKEDEPFIDEAFDGNKDEPRLKIPLVIGVDKSGQPAIGHFDISNKIVPQKEEKDNLIELFNQKPIDSVQKKPHEEEKGDQSKDPGYYKEMDSEGQILPVFYDKKDGPVASVGEEMILHGGPKFEPVQNVSGDENEQRSREAENRPPLKKAADKNVKTVEIFKSDTI